MEMLFLYENLDGERQWEKLPSNSIPELAIRLQSQGCDPACFLVCPALELRKLFPDYKKRERKAVAPRTEQSPAYGWLSPDARFFPCPYGGHMAKAREIVGYLTEPPKDAWRYLEDSGWVILFKDPTIAAPISVWAKRMTDRQCEWLQHNGFSPHTPGFAKALEESA